MLGNCSQHQRYRALKSLYFCCGDAQLYGGGGHTQAPLCGFQPPGFQLDLLDDVQNWIKVLQQTLIYKM